MRNRRLKKKIFTTVQTCMININRKKAFELFFGIEHPEYRHIYHTNVVRIKFEIDTNPPKGCCFESARNTLPEPFTVTINDAPSLFAGKISAL